MGQTLEKLKVTISGIPHEALDGMWPIIVDHIVKGLEYGHGELDVEDIYRGLKARDMQLWSAFQSDGECVASLVTEIFYFGKKKVMRFIVIGGGHMADWLDNIDILQEWAKENGCERVEAYCRDGLARRLEKYGYKKLYNLCGVDL
tara:strand:+ start:1393 stop:1830 length:438 start_codon:yes stop_codon:yes gene_type:complete